MIQIKPLKKENIEQFVSVHFACWRDTYYGLFDNEVFESREQKKERRVEHIKSRLTDPNYFYYALYDDFQIKGICIFSIIDGYGIIDAIYLMREYQKQGYGKSFFELIKTEFKKRNISIFSAYVLNSLETNEVFLKWGGKYVGEEEITIHGKDYKEREYVF